MCVCVCVCVCSYTVVSAAEQKKSDMSSAAIPNQISSPSTSVSVDGSSAMTVSEVETVHPTTTEGEPSVPAAAGSDPKPPAPPKPPTGKLTRRRGRPLTHNSHASERRHLKLLDVSTVLHFHLPRYTTTVFK